MTPEFRAASEVAEGWPTLVHMVAKLRQRKSAKRLVETVYQTLIVLRDQYAAHADVLHDAKEELARVSDGPIRWEPGRGWSGIGDSESTYPERWSSATEAACGIARMAIEMLLRPIDGLDEKEGRKVLLERLTKRAPALTIPLDEEADLRERIVGERAKLQVPKAVLVRDGVVRIEGQPPIRLPEQYAVVLGGLLELGGAAESKELDYYGGGAKMLREMCDRFPPLQPLITLPGRKGQGGYRTTIKDGR